MVVLYDSFGNIINGFNAGNTKYNNAQLQPGTFLSQGDLDILFKYSWVVRKICESFPKDTFKNWIDIQTDNPDKLKLINKIIKKLKIKQKFINSNIWARLYGGSIALLGVNDEKNIAEPLDINNIKSLDFINVFDRYQVEINEFYEDPVEGKYMEPKFYRIYSLSAKSTGMIVHESRVLRFNGAILPDMQMYSINKGWADSVITALFESYKRYDIGQTSGAETMQDFVIKVLKLNDLPYLLKHNAETEIFKRIQYANKKMSIDGITVLAPDDDMTKIGTPVQGLVDLIKTQKEDVGAGGGIPRTKLFGEQTGTLAGAEETHKQYQSELEILQEHNWDNINTILTIITKLPEINLEEDKWSWEFNSTFTRSEKEIAEERKLIAETDNIYLSNGVVAPIEIRNSRFGDKYSIETQLDDEISNIEEDISKAIQEEKDEESINEEVNSEENS